jgi:LytS/YehU family sensor histidine kinase
MELNPHFLFNTLSAISGLVAHDRGAEAQEVVRRLGVLLRRTLERGTEPFSSVADEIELLEDYLFIQRTRFSDRLFVGLDIDRRARDCLIPSMLLQPLVENAIRHGIEPGAGRGEVSIAVQRAAGSLRIVIADTGAGFAFDGEGKLAHEGVGISNTRARLAHLFGTRASLTLANRRGGGSEATVVLPAAEHTSLARGPLT